MVIIYRVNWWVMDLSIGRVVGHCLNGAFVKAVFLFSVTASADSVWPRAVNLLLASKKCSSQKKPDKGRGGRGSGRSNYLY